MTTLEKPQTETERLFADLDKPSLHALSYALRHPDTWPEGFVWNYEHCSQCAIGLAGHLWRRKIGIRLDNDGNVSRMARSFAMPYEAALDIFMGEGDWVPTRRRCFILKDADFEAVTPEMVADQIDAYLAKVE